MVNLLLAQMQVIDFVSELWTELAIIINGSNLVNFDEVKEMAKNIKSASLINKNVMTVVVNWTISEVKKLKAQILELKAEIKKAKYILKEDQKLIQNIRENRKPFYKGSNYKPVNKRNLKCYKCNKKEYFKSECWSKPKD